jgi:hypothetical protein
MPDVFETSSTELVSGTGIGSVTSSKIHRVSSQDLGSTLTGSEYYRRMDPMIPPPNVVLRVSVQETRNSGDYNYSASWHLCELV